MERVDKKLEWNDEKFKRRIGTTKIVFLTMLEILKEKHELPTKLVALSSTPNVPPRLCNKFNVFTGIQQSAGAGTMERNWSTEKSYATTTSDR